MLKYGIFFVPHRDCWEDSWTYGEWRQYICNRPGGQTRCARLAFFPFILSAIAIALLVVGCLALYLQRELNWGPWLIIMGLSGLWLLIHGTWMMLGFNLMIGVGPTNNGAKRVMPGEEVK